MTTMTLYGQLVPLYPDAVVTFAGHISDLHTLFEIAEAAMYRAKRISHDQVQSWSRGLVALRRRRTVLTRGAVP